MMNMNLIAVVTPPSMYHGCSTDKTLWEGKFTLSAINMKHCVRRNVSKHGEIKGSDNYITLEMFLKYDSLKKMIITSSESKDTFGRSGKGLITSLGLKAKVRPKNYKKSRHSIRNFSKKYLSKIIRKFDKLLYKSYERIRPKHEPTDSYFYQKDRLRSV